MLHKTRKQIKTTSAITLMLLLIANTFVYAENTDDAVSIDVLEETVSNDELPQDILTTAGADDEEDILDKGEEEISEI